MNKPDVSNLKLGVIAGGQLGKMLVQAASAWDVTSHVMDPDAACSARGVADVFTQADFRDYDAVCAFGTQVDVLTYEIEHINIDALYKLKKDGVAIAPDPDILALIQDKGAQKTFYRDHGIPTAPFELYDGADDIREAVRAGAIDVPFVQKLRTGGYDGRGVAVIRDENELDALLNGPSVVEPKIDIQTEIAVIAARNADGEVRCFPAVEMVFDDAANLVERLACPANIGEDAERRAAKIAAALIEQLGMTGLLAVEFFIDRSGAVIVNEAAPRPHNSGHHTIESAVTSQYEQHLRAILNLPLGDPSQVAPAVMINLLGEDGHEGPVKYDGLEGVLSVDGAHLHIYGKKITRPFRKMGHVTVTAHTMAEAQAKADTVKQALKVKSWDSRAQAS